MEIAIGVLGWSPEYAMTADPAFIDIGFDGRFKHDQQLYRVILATQGMHLPGEDPKERANAFHPTAFRDFVKSHNAIMSKKARSARGK